MRSTPERSRLGVFRHRRFAAFWIAGLASNTGTWLHVIASTIVVFEATASTSELGLLGFASYLPLLLFTLPAGVITDRLDRRHVVLISHAIGGLAAAALALAVHLGGTSTLQFAMIGFAIYTTYAIAKPAISSIFPNLVPREDIASATAVNSLSYVLGQLLGPLLAALCVAAGAPALAFALNAVSYAAVMLVVARLSPGEVGGGSRVQRDVLTELRAGFRYVLGRGDLVALLAVLLVIAPLPEVIRLLAPAISVRAGNPEETAGIVAAAVGLGSATGLSLAARSYAIEGVRRRVTIGATGAAVASAMVAFAPTLPSVVLAAFASGAGFGLAFASLTAAIQASIDDAMRGRVLAVHTLAHLGTRPIFTPVAGWLAAVVGLGATGITFAALVPLGLLALWRSRGVGGVPRMSGPADAVDGSRAPAPDRSRA